ncbi:MAG: hypothetical protein Q4P17_07605 [Methanobacterium sp.]|nr:hypothetical protein [Methanobacterium sp.]
MHFLKHVHRPTLFLIVHFTIETKMDNSNYILKAHYMSCVKNNFTDTPSETFQ